MNPEIYKGVPVPDGLRPAWDQVEAAWWMRGVQKTLDTVRPLLEALIDDEPCTVDHHGYCQTHWGGEVDGRCEVAAAREFLRESAPVAVWRSTIINDPHLYWCLNHRPALAVTEVRLADIHPSVEVQCVQCGRAAR